MKPNRFNDTLFNLCGILTGVCIIATPFNFLYSLQGTNIALPVPPPLAIMAMLFAMGIWSELRRLKDSE